MKKSMWAFAMLFSVAVGFSSCKGDCCDCAAGVFSGEYCEDDYTSAGGISWEEFKDDLEAAGCECD